MKFASMFTGGGGFDVGALQAGLELTAGLELDPRVAEVANLNLGGHVRVGDAVSHSPQDFGRIDFLHASPPCTSFSTLNKNAGETELDIALGESVALHITALRPKYFTLENVRDYKKAMSWRLIEKTLIELGYSVDAQVVNAADFGVPQGRIRMIVRACRDGEVPPLVPTHAGNHVSWHESIADLIPGLPVRPLANWQASRLNRSPRFWELLRLHGGEEQFSLLIRANNANSNGKLYKTPDETSFAVTAKDSPMRVIQVNGSGIYGSSESGFLSDEDEVSPTVTRKNIGGRRIVTLPDLTTRYASVRCSARFQTFPDDYALPDGQPLYVLLNNGGSVNGGIFRTEMETAHTVTTHSAGSRRVLRLPDFATWSLNTRVSARFQDFPDEYILPKNATLAQTIIGNAVPPLLARRVVESLVNQSAATVTPQRGQVSIFDFLGDE